MAAAPGFRETLRALEKKRFTGGAVITVPVTVAFGTRDRGTLWVWRDGATSCPTRRGGFAWAGRGHVPMFDDPTRPPRAADTSTGGGSTGRPSS